MASSSLHLLLLALYAAAVDASPPPPIVTCTADNANCTLSNAYGSFSDRSTCRISQVAYPSNETELLLTVSSAAARKQHMKAITVHGHSRPKLACPGGPSGSGLAISTRRLNKVLGVQKDASRMTVESGITVRDFIDAAAAEGLALPYTPYWQGMSMGGLLATGTHGSSLFGKGAAVHEYVVGMRVVVATAAPVGGLHAKVIDLKEDDEDLFAAKVSLGVLGIVSQITFQLQPMFKRSVNFRVDVDDGLESKMVPFGMATEFGDVTWYPSQFKALYRDDFRLPVTAEGTGVNDLLAGVPFDALAKTQASAEAQEAWEDASGKCINAKLQVSSLPNNAAHKYFSDGTRKDFRGFPVIGFQNDMQGSASCLNSSGDSVCLWDSRVNGPFFNSAMTVPITSNAAFIADVKKLRDANPDAFCGLDLFGGLVMRYMRNSTAYLGRTSDSVDLDFMYYRSHDKSSPRLFEDVLEEFEQMALFKYGGLPHLGKNRNVAFLRLREKLGAKGGRFVDVMRRFDPQGLFSSDWTDAVLRLRGKSLVVDEPGCALDGMCICSRDEHCAPHKGYLCRPGLVYEKARVCRKVINVRSA